MITLYDYLDSGNSYKIRLLFNQLHIPYRRIDTDILAGETRTGAFLKISSVGKVPTVQLADGTVLVESNAILWHFARGTDLLPDDPMSQTRVLQWMFFEQNHIETTIAEARYQIHIVKQPEKFKPQLDHRHPRGVHALNVMENHLENRQFFVDNRYTIADIAIYAYTHEAEEGGFDLSPYPRLNDWFQRVAAQPDHIRVDDASVGKA